MRMSQSESRPVAHCMYVEIELKKKILILKVWFYENSVKLRQSPTHALTSDRVRSSRRFQKSLAARHRIRTAVNMPEYFTLQTPTALSSPTSSSLPSSFSSHCKHHSTIIIIIIIIASIILISIPASSSFVIFIMFI